MYKRQGENLTDLPTELLPNGVEVAIYRLSRVKRLEVKRLEVSRRLVKMDAADPDDDGEETAPAAAEEETRGQVRMPFETGGGVVDEPGR